MSQDERAARRAQMRAFFPEVLKAIWMDNTIDEAIALWTARIAAGGSFPRNALECLDYVLTDPPPDLVELLHQHGWIYLVHEDDPEEPPFTFEENLEWLREQVERLHEVYDQAKSGR